MLVEKWERVHVSRGGEQSLHQGWKDGGGGREFFKQIDVCDILVLVYFEFKLLCNNCECVNLGGKNSFTYVSQRNRGLVSPLYYATPHVLYQRDAVV